MTTASTEPTIWLEGAEDIGPSARAVGSSVDALGLLAQAALSNAPEAGGLRISQPPSFPPPSHGGARSNAGRRRGSNNRDVNRPITPHVPRKSAAIAAAAAGTPLTCIAASCTVMVSVPNARCKKHGGSTLCSARGCTTNAKTRGRCWKHGGNNGQCTAPGCTTNAHVRGLCWKHGANGVCVEHGCSTSAVAEGLCFKHGGKGTCRLPGCTTNAANLKQGLCVKHGGNGVCTFTGCTSNVKARGLCTKHGGNGKCSFEGCKSNARARGVCGKHGGNGVCIRSGCTAHASQRRLCVAHGGRGTCSVNGCSTTVVSRGLCVHHGARAGAMEKKVKKTNIDIFQNRLSVLPKVCSIRGCRSINTDAIGLCNEHSAAHGGAAGNFGSSSSMHAAVFTGRNGLNEYEYNTSSNHPLLYTINNAVLAAAAVAAAASEAAGAGGVGADAGDFMANAQGLVTWPSIHLSGAAAPMRATKGMKKGKLVVDDSQGCSAKSCDGIAHTKGLCFKHAQMSQPRAQGGRSGTRSGSRT